MIDWCLTPTLAVFQLYHGVTINVGIINYYTIYLEYGNISLSFHDNNVLTCFLNMNSLFTYEL